MSFNEALQIKANREIIDSIFNPIKDAYSRTMSKEVLAKYEHMFARHKFMRITIDIFGDVYASCKTDKVPLTPLTDEEWELLPGMQEIFSAIEMLQISKKPSYIKTKCTEGWYIRIGENYFIVSDKVPLCDGYYYDIQMTNRRIGKHAAILSPVSVLSAKYSNIDILKGDEK